MVIADLGHFLDKENLCGEVVAEPVEEHAAAKGAQGVAQTVAIDGLEELAVEHIGAHKGELRFVFALVVMGKVAVEYNLVEKVPATLIGQAFGAGFSCMARC